VVTLDLHKIVIIQQKQQPQDIQKLIQLNQRLKVRMVDKNKNKWIFNPKKILLKKVEKEKRSIKK